jgi:hypothetical protein
LERGFSALVGSRFPRPAAVVLPNPLVQGLLVMQGVLGECLELSRRRVLFVVVPGSARGRNAATGGLIPRRRIGPAGASRRWGRSRSPLRLPFASRSLVGAAPVPMMPASAAGQGTNSLFGAGASRSPASPRRTEERGWVLAGYRDSSGAVAPDLTADAPACISNPHVTFGGLNGYRSVVSIEDALAEDVLTAKRFGHGRADRDHICGICQAAAYLTLRRSMALAAAGGRKS